MFADPTQAGGPPPQQAAGAAAAQLVIPDEVKAKYGDLIELILASESMNDEERQYWINILPIMTPEQVQNLRDILQNEKRQLASIDAKYSKEIEQMGQAQFIQQVGEARKKRNTERKDAEQTDKQKEDQAAEALLKQIEGA